jgi:hypothetical protein
VYQIPHIVQTISVGRVLADRIWPLDGLTSAVGVHPMRELIPPGVALSLDTAACGFLPFSFRGEAIALPAHLAQPATVGDGVEPTDGYDGLVWMVEPRIAPAFRDAMSCRPQKTGIFPIGHRILGEGKSAHPYPVHRLLVLLTGLTAHQKIPSRDGHQLGFDEEGRVMRTE